MFRLAQLGKNQMMEKSKYNTVSGINPHWFPAFHLQDSCLVGDIRNSLHYEGRYL